MALGSLNLRVSQSDFEQRIALIDQRMTILADVVRRYESAKRNMDQFIESDDSNFDAMCANIDQYIENAKRAHGSLNETKLELQRTVEQMGGMSNQVKEVIGSATEAAKSTLEAAIQVNSIL